MNVQDYEEIRKEFNYVVIHDLVDEVLRGSSFARRELAGLMAITFDLSSVSNWHLAKLHNRLMADIIENPQRRITIAELDSAQIGRLYTLKELREIAKTLDVRGRTKMNSEELAVAIKEAMINGCN